MRAWLTTLAVALHCHSARHTARHRPSPWCGIDPTRPPRACWTERSPSRDVAAAAGPEHIRPPEVHSEQSSSSRQRCGSRQPTGSPQAGPTGSFDPGLQPAGATKVLGVGVGPGDEQGGWAAARAARWRLRDGQHGQHSVTGQPKLQVQTSKMQHMATRIIDSPEMARTCTIGAFADWAWSCWWVREASRRESHLDDDQRLHAAVGHLLLVRQLV